MSRQPPGGDNLEGRGERSNGGVPRETYRDGFKLTDKLGWKLGTPVNTDIIGSCARFPLGLGRINADVLGNAKIGRAGGRVSGGRALREGTTHGIYYPRIYCR